MVIKLRTSSRWRSQNRPFDSDKLAIVECFLYSVWPWWRNRSSGINRGVRLHICCRCIIGFIGLWHSVRCRLYSVFSHDHVIGFSGVSGGSLRILNLHLRSWRVGHGHVHFRNNFFSDGGSRDTFFYLFLFG